MDFFKDIIQKLQQGKIESAEELQREKLRLARKYKLGALPRNSEILAQVPEELHRKLKPILRIKPVRTLSGVAVVAVMTSPAPCPHGTCIFCPGGVKSETPQSYTGKEPAALRAGTHAFDPFEQARSRVGQLSAIGHHVDKIDLIIMGGTFSAREKDYQEWFVKRCLDAFNGEDAPDIEKAKLLNEKAPRRCVGLTIETRPDWLRKGEINQIKRMGATRVELGVQTLSDKILDAVGRGHTVQDSIRATQLAKDAGIKVCYHMMPGLPGATPAGDVENFRQIFSDERFMPDMLKIYPALVVKGTKLYEMWKKGEYVPLSTEKCTALIADALEHFPRWVRIQRIQRDIPAPLIEAGVTKSNLHQLVAGELEKRGRRCPCIRCREVGIARNLEKDMPSPKNLELKRDEYAASGGLEVFLSVEDPETDLLVGYARLRRASRDAFRPEIPEGCGVIRELKVLGEMVPLGAGGKGRFQHRGLGEMLISECKAIVSDQWGKDAIVVSNGIGTVGYYSKFGFLNDGDYMIKKLN